MNKDEIKKLIPSLETSLLMILCVLIGFLIGSIVMCESSTDVFNCELGQREITMCYINDDNQLELYYTCVDIDATNYSIIDISNTYWSTKEAVI